MSVPYTSGPEQPVVVPSPRPTPVAPPRNGAATASLVLGIVSVVTSLWFLPAVVGLVLGIVGVGRARRTTPATGTGKAVAGIVLSAVSLLIGVWIVSALAGDDGADLADTTQTVQQDAAGRQDTGRGGASTEPPEEAEPEADAALPGIGDPVRDGKFEFTVTKIEAGVPRIGDQHFGEEAQGQFVLVHLTVENIGDGSQFFDGGNVTGYDPQGREFSADTGAAIYLDDSNSFLNEINPGNAVDGVVVFDVPEDVELHRLELHDSLFSGGVEVALR